jgi:hypothetical protein
MRFTWPDKQLSSPTFIWSGGSHKCSLTTTYNSGLNSISSPLWDSTTLLSSSPSSLFFFIFWGIFSGFLKIWRTRFQQRTSKLRQTLTRGLVGLSPLLILLRKWGWRRRWYLIIQNRPNVKSEEKIRRII